MLATTDLKHTSWSNCLWHKVNKPKSSSLATIGVLRERGSGGFAQRYSAVSPLTGLLLRRTWLMLAGHVGH